MGGNDNSSSTSLAPGFRFHPTDEELVSYYLKRKVCGKPFRFDAISEIAIYKAEPWDLPGLSKLKSRDLEWYFFSVLDKKYGNGSRTNRATVEGYWKTTGKDRPVQHKCRVVGMKKTLVYHRGRAPRGERTNWVMHEYKLADEELEKAGIPQESFTLCRVFHKSGTGPKNGEQYGAPFVEEEWDNENEVDSMPGETFDDAIFVTKANDIEQNHGVEPSENSAPPLNIYQGGESSNFVQETTNNVETDPKLFSGVDEGLRVLERNEDKKFINLPMQPETEATKSDLNTQPSISVSHAPNNSQPETQCFDNISSIDEGFFLEANDLSEPIEAHSTNFELDDYLTYFDADDDIAQYLDFDSSELMDVSAILSDQSVNENLDLVAQRPSISNQQSAETNIAGVSSSKQVKEAPKAKSDSNYPFMKQASRMLGSFYAPPAFASEFPTKDMAARLQAAAQSSDSVHVSTGMLNIRNLTMNNDTWYFDKLGNLNVQVSFNLPLPEGIVSSSGGLESLTGMASGKIASFLSRRWFCNFFFGVIILAISAKLGTCIYAK